MIINVSLKKLLRIYFIDSMCKLRGQLKKAEEDFMNHLSCLGQDWSTLLLNRKKQMNRHLFLIECIRLIKETPLIEQSVAFGWLNLSEKDIKSL